MIYVFLANGFEEVEAITPIDYLRRCGFQVTTVGVESKTVRGSHGIDIVCDITEGEVDLSDITAVILPGGMPGTVNLQQSTVVKLCIEKCSRQNGVIAAICAAPSVLGEYGILDGKKATCYPGFEDKLTGAEYVDEPAVRCGNIVTSRGAGCANQFALEIIKALDSEQKANEIAESVRM